MEIKVKTSITLIGIGDYAKKVGVSHQAILYAIRRDNIDHAKIGSHRFVAMTEKTKEYEFMQYPRKGKKSKVKKEVTEL